MARKQEIRNLRESKPTIIGAGITEKYYFVHLKRLHNYFIDIKPRFFGSDCAYYMDKYVEDVLSAGGMAICVYDLDVTRNNAKENQHILNFQKKYENNRNVLLCGSMPSIEYWFLLHYEQVNRYFSSSDKVIENLRKYTAFTKHTDYLSRSNWVERLDKHISDAINRAKELKETGPSYTYLWRAIEYLESQKIQ